MSTAISDKSPPVDLVRLEQIAKDACDSALGTAESYVHSQATHWNAAIIQSILKSLISETSTGPTNQPPFKYVVNSTLIQHITPSGPVTDSSSAGRRGMHSAMGAYWNNDKDGMWSWKYEGGEKKGMDIVVSVSWIAV